MYYILNTETGLYFGGYNHWRAYGNRDGVNWRKKPRIYMTKGAAKLSALEMLEQYQWSILHDDIQDEYRQNVIAEYGERYPRASHLDKEWADRRGMHAHWHTIKHKPLEELLPPHLELRTVTL